MCVSVSVMCGLSIFLHKISAHCPYLRVSRQPVISTGRMERRFATTMCGDSHGIPATAAPSPDSGRGGKWSAAEVTLVSRVTCHECHVPG